MTTFDEQIDPLVAQPRKRHFYRIDLRAGADSIAKSMELYTPNIGHPLAQVLSYPAKRAAEVWKKGEFACSISREPIAVKMGQD